MKLMEYRFKTQSASDEFSFFPIGDIHVGASNCAEDKIRKLVKLIQSKKNAYWISGGDACDAVILNDTKRFDPTVLPGWMLENQGAEKVRKNLTDMLSAQQNRLYELMDPIRDRCLGFIEGNHEYSIMKHHNRNFLAEMCEHFNCPDLTDCAFIRLKFDRKGGHTDVVRMFISHGHGGGRTSGAEPNILHRLAADKEVDIILKGHSHTFCIHPPIPVLSIPSRGELGSDPTVYDKFAANWGAYVYTYKAGPSTYASRANYPARPMYTVECHIKPCTDHGTPAIALNAIRL